MEPIRLKDAEEVKRHNIGFALRDEVSIGVLNGILEWFDVALDNDDGVLYFYIRMTREEVQDFKQEYDWALSYICDMDQEDGGPFNL